MDKSQSEVTEQIRKTIKKKLGEINAFIDDELPDYIMILVANKRSKSHMEKDLALFLGKDTASFTTWLWDLVNNLKANPKQKVSSTVLNEDDVYKRTDEDADVLNLDLNEQEGDLEPDDDNNNVLNQPATVVQPVVSKNTTLTKPKSQPLPTTVSQKCEANNSVQEKSEAEMCKASKKYLPERGHTTVLKHKTQIKQEQEALKPTCASTVSSVVHMSHKSTNRPALKANKLLLRAVDDATKSVLDGKTINEYYKPTPIDILSNKKENSPNLVNVSAESTIEYCSETLNKQINKLLSKESTDDTSFNTTETDEFLVESPSKASRTIFLPSNKNTSSEELFFFDVDSFEDTDKNTNSPHFIVTLDGADSSLKRKHVDDLSDESMDVDEEGLLVVEEDQLIEKKPKLGERCKYWPACKNSDDCLFHHPTIPCKCFPDCKFGDKCLYIHPNCKFDALCSRKDCPFTHASKRKFPVQLPSAKPRSTKIVCKFFPNCTSKNCSFIHPKICKYGSNCRTRGCHFSHFNIPSRNQLTWKAC